ncbi:protein Aster-B-like isoform X1 [Bradysia coprophila]|uniref:protein Aster-B-like isoform X1 n=1 Tax=Bradysia coprophila TaxID=38358 RepID=UPI00187DD6D5|nr:protein Aster-B-like isoform X1 [Bradysia coprophila]XP_037049014.1 protein Aster-B-like isoform X1 [Bradysia coprophila]
MESTNQTDLSPTQTGHLLESKIFRNFSRLSRKKPKIDSPNVKMSELLVESSDSGNEKPEFTNDFECTSPAHEWRKLINIILPVSVEALRNELFSKSKFMEDFHAMRKHYDIHNTEWERSDDGKMRRTIKYKMPLTTNLGFGPKFTSITQMQTESSCCIPNRFYAVDVVNSNENIPYADVFEVAIHHCMLSTIDNHTMYSVYGQLRYKKSAWGVVKSRIEKNCLAGMDEYYIDLQNTLQKELCTPPSKGKRSSRKKLSFSIKQQAISNQSGELDPIMEFKEDSPSKEASILMWLTFSILVAVIAMSAVLLFKLWKLEQELTIEPMPEYDSLRSIERSSEEWIQLLRNQQNIHETNVQKWLNILEVAVTLIQNTERVLVELIEQVQLKGVTEIHSVDKCHIND